MTDKQLKKLSRLEVLELLLEQTKINEQLRIEIAGLENELSVVNRIQVLDKLTAQMQSSVDTLSEKAKQMEALLESRNVRMENHEQTASEDSDENKKEQPAEENVNQPEKPEKAGNKTEEKTAEEKIRITGSNRYSNINLYSRLMYFYYKNEDALNVLPDDIQRDVREKLRGILNGEKK